MEAIANESLAEKLTHCFANYRQESVTITNIKQLSGGASAETLQFQYKIGERLYQGILRRSAIQQASQFSTSIAKSTEARVQQTCREYGIPVPEILFCLQNDDGLGDGYAMTCVAGESIPRKILRDPKLQNARDQLTQQCGKILGQIHQVDTTPLQHLLDDQSALQQLRSLEALYRSYQQPSAVFEVAFRWLYSNAAEENSLTLVHGDFRNGNLMIDENGIAAVLDWELCHLGNPVEDLGWLCVNAWRFGSRLPVGGFGELEELLDAYYQHTGRQVSQAEVHYWQLFGTLRWGIICMFQGNCYSSGLNTSMELAAIGRRVSETEYDLLNLLDEKS